MKPVQEVVAAVIDFGTFLSVAEKLAETMKTVFYHSPFQVEYLDVRDCMLGTGLDKVDRLDEIFDRLDEIDLFVFPDIGFGDLQRHLRSMGKAVWGNMGASEMELYRTDFLDLLKDEGMPVIHSEKVKGVTALAAYLKKHPNVWVKIDRYRGNMETWQNSSWPQTQRTLESIAVIFGPAKEQVDFICQDDIKSDFEVGYDGWCIDGKFPSHSFQGYEKKNELYLGSVLADADLPDEIKFVNEKMAPILANYGYRNWWATEIRVADGVPYFIDPTPRMPGQTGEHQLESIKNFADIIWQGANGGVLEPEFNWNFAAEATLHYDGDTIDHAIAQEWKTLDIPKEVLRWVKMYHYCKIDGLYHFMAEGTDEVGVVIGKGNSVQASIENLAEHLEMLKGQPVHASTVGFAGLIETIKEAEKEGLPFGGRIPKPEQIYREFK
jgi:hypothetical protein